MRSVRSRPFGPQKTSFSHRGKYGSATLMIQRKFMATWAAALSSIASVQLLCALRHTRSRQLPRPEKDEEDEENCVEPEGEGLAWRSSDRAQFGVPVKGRRLDAVVLTMPHSHYIGR